jgi:hypothetical protein
MDEKQIVEGNLGEVGKYDIDFKEGKLCVELTAAVGPLDAGLVVKLDAGKVLDALAKAIPGQIDDAFIAMAKQALGAK